MKKEEKEKIEGDIPIVLIKLYHKLPIRYQKLVKRCYKFISEAYRKFIANLKFTFFWPFIRNKKIKNINLFEQKIYSQNGEDGIIKIIFYKIVTTNKFCVEFGVGDGHGCNTRYLIEKEGWGYLHMDSGDYTKPYTHIKKEFITAENINSLFRKYNVPKEFDLLSIDIDYNTYWVWRAIKGYRPRVVVIEYNASISPTESKTVKYDPDRMWDGTNYFGASLLTLAKLGKSKGYTLIGCDSVGINAFFVRNDLIKNNFEIKTIKEIYRPPKYGKKINGRYVGHPPSSKSMVSV